jgi:hypothetical protein
MIATIGEKVNTGHFEFSKDRSIIDYKLSNRIKFELSLGQSSRKKLGGQKKKNGYT